MRESKYIPIDAVNRIKEVWYKSGKTQTELARMCGIPRKTMVTLLNGDGNMELSTFYRYCAGCKVSADYLLFGKKPDETLP